MKGCRDSLRTARFPARIHELEWPGLFRLDCHHLLRAGLSSLHQGLPVEVSKGELTSLSVSEDDDARGAEVKNSGEGETAREWAGVLLAVDGTDDLVDVSWVGNKKSGDCGRARGVRKVVAGEWRFRGLDMATSCSTSSSMLVGIGV